MNKKAKQMMWCITAALATGGVVESETFDDFEQKSCKPCESVDLPVHFAHGAALTSQGNLKTASGYEVRIDRVSLNPCEVDVFGTQVAQACEKGSVSLEQGGAQIIRLSGVQLEGRVFDTQPGHEGRLPCEGVVIEGSMPVDVLVKKTRRLDPNKPWRSKEILTVDYTLPTEIFEGVDWSKLGQG